MSDRCRKLTLEMLQKKGTDQKRTLSICYVNESRGQVKSSAMKSLARIKSVDTPQEYDLFISHRSGDLSFGMRFRGDRNDSLLV